MTVKLPNFIIHWNTLVFPYQDSLGVLRLCLYNLYTLVRTPHYNGAFFCYCANSSSYFFLNISFGLQKLLNCKRKWCETFRVARSYVDTVQKVFWCHLVLQFLRYALIRQTMKVRISLQALTRLSCALNMILMRPRPIFYMVDWKHHWFYPPFRVYHQVNED